MWLCAGSHEKLRRLPELFVRPIDERFVEPQTTSAGGGGAARHANPTPFDSRSPGLRHADLKMRSSVRTEMKVEVTSGVRLTL